MDKKVYEVPSGIRYISELEGIFEIPNFPCIIDKQLTGCGFTHWVINNNEDVVLCSPRRLLLENKEDQNPHVLYIRNDSDKESSYEKDISGIERYNPENDNVDTELSMDQHINMKNQIRDYISKCNNPFNRVPCKILVTYDSFRIVKEVLSELSILPNFRVVVDEFQSIFVDSRFKSTTELGFVNQLRDIDKVCFVSATPMIEEYLDDLEDFCELPYLQLDWGKLDPMRVMKPALDVKSIGQSINTMAKKIIRTYLDGDFEKTVVRDGDGNNIEIESREAVIFVNSVKNITDIIRSSELSPEQVNILCSDTPQNQIKINKTLKKLKHLGDYKIGKVPGYGDLHKMFTFCTRTVYLGADFYSTNARSFIFSDANIDCLAVDITLDLPQILGRQRLECNPWKNKGSLYVRLLNKDKQKSKEELEQHLSRKIKSTEVLMEWYSSATTDEQRMEAAIKFENDIKSNNYRRDYIAVDRHRGSFPIPVPNKLVMLSEKRAFEIQQDDYADRFRLFNALDNYVSLNNGVSEFFSEFESEGEFTKKMRLLCEYGFTGQELDYILQQLPSEFAKYYYTLGPEKIKVRAYNRSYLEKDYNKLMFNTTSMADEIYSVFSEKDKLTTQEIIDKLQLIYNHYGNPNRPKAIDLKDFFEITKTRKTVTIDGIKVVKDGFKLIKKLY